MHKPLADRLRPNRLEEVFGQEHILGENKILNRILKSGVITNMIFYGPPGVGKTTVANIIAKMTNKRFYKLNATNASVKDIKAIVNELDTLFSMDGVLLYLDEIQNFNKKQQQALLEFIEIGKITLIASTTENPYHFVYKAILSRSTIFEFKLLDKEDIIRGLKRALGIVQNEFKNSKIYCEDKALEYIAEASNGDLRKAMNSIEIAIYSTKKDDKGIIHIDKDIAVDATQKKMFHYDKGGDSHYDILSAFQKSIRGSDPNAAIHYLARLIRAGDLISICRRLLVITAEDIGLAYPNAMPIVKACVDAAFQLGLPEARIPLAEATILLATVPKSNSAIKAIDLAMRDIETKDIGDIPIHLKDAHYGGAAKLGRGIEYKYPHDYPNNYVKQEYLPKKLIGIEYYRPGNNRMEKNMEDYLKKIKE